MAEAMKPFVLSTGDVHEQGTGLSMYLKRYGRWISIGNRHLQILTWPRAESAQAAAIVAATPRGRTIRAVPACATTTTSGGYLPNCSAVRDALLGNVPYSPALAARVDLLQAKTRASSPAVHGASLQRLDAESIKAASLGLRAQGWCALTFFSAAQHQIGLRALELVDELQENGGADADIPALVQFIAVAGAMLRDVPAGPARAVALAKALQIIKATTQEMAEQEAA